VNVLHRYLLRELVGTAFGAVGLFTFVLLTGNAIKDLIGRLADGIISVGASVELVVMLVPFVMTYALPIGLLTAVLLTMGRVSAQNEVTAMRSAGIGLMRIGAPVLFFAVVGVAVSLVINFTYAPRMRGAYREILTELGRTNPLNLIAPRTFVRDFPGFVIYVGEKDGVRLRDVWVWKRDDDNDPGLLAHGREANVHLDENSGVLSVDLIDSRVQFELFNPERAPVLGFGSTFSIDQNLSEVFKRKPFEKKIGWLEFGELVALRAQLMESTNPDDRRRLLDVNLDLHEKASLAFAVLSFAIVGVPLGIQTRRKETSANLGVALLLVMGFYLLLNSARWVTSDPAHHPELLLWLPNVAFQALGGWMWWRFGRN
jgi:lipopolysaccharide export system permease protein